MRNTLYGLLAVGLLLFIQNNVNANSINDCKPSVNIQPIKGNYIPLLQGDIAKLESFFLQLAEQNADYCNASLNITYKKGVETKQSVTHGNPKYNEELFLEVQYYLPNYEVVIENSSGDVLHQLELGKDLQSLNYENSKSKNHDALYAEWRRVRRAKFRQMESDANSLEKLISFLEQENGIEFIKDKPLAVVEKKEVLSAKGDEIKKEEKTKSIVPKKESKKEIAKIENKIQLNTQSKEVEKIAKKSESKQPENSNNKSRIKEEVIEKATSASKPKIESQSKKIEEVAEETKSKSSQSKIESTTKISINPAKEKEEVVGESVSVLNSKTETQSEKIEKIAKKPEAKQKESVSKSRTEVSNSKANSKETVAEKTISTPKKPTETQPTEAKKITKKLEAKQNESKPESTSKSSNNKSTKAKAEQGESQVAEKVEEPIEQKEDTRAKMEFSEKSAKPKDLISDDDMFGAANVAEPLGEMVQFEFCSKSTYSIINESGFSMQVNTGRENKKDYAEYTISPNQKGVAKNEFKNGDWYSITYPEELHLKDLESYKKEVASIWSELKNPKMESDFNRLYTELNPNLQKIMEEQPNINNQILPVVATAFEKFLAQTGTQSFKEEQNQEAKEQIQMYLSRLVKSYELFHYYKYTISSSAAHRPANEILNFKKGSKKKLSPNFILKGSVNWFLFNKNDGFSQYLESWPNTQLNAEIGLPFERTKSKGDKIGAMRPYLTIGYHRQVFKFISPNNYYVGGDYLKNGDGDSKIGLAITDKINLRSESVKLGLLIKSIAPNRMYFDIGGGIERRMKSKIIFNGGTEYLTSPDELVSDEQEDVLASATTPYAQFRFGKLFILGSSSKKCGTKLKGGFDLFLSGYFSKVDLSAGENYHLYISEFSPTNEIPLVDLAPFKKWYFQLGAGVGYAF